MSQFKRDTTTDLITNGKYSSDATGTIVETLGFTAKGDGGGAQWKKTGNTITASQTPAQLGDAKCSDADGNEFELVLDGGWCDPVTLGAIADFSAGVGTDNYLVMVAAATTNRIKIGGNIGWASTLAISAACKIDLNGFTIGPLSGLALADNFIEYLGPNLGFNTAQQVDIEIFNGKLDGQAREFIRYLTDPATGDPIADPVTNKTRNPNYNTRSYLFQANRTDGLSLHDLEFTEQESFCVGGIGNKNVNFYNLSFKDCCKTDDTSSAIFLTPFGSFYHVIDISATNPAVVTFAQDYNIANGATVRFVNFDLVDDQTDVTLTQLTPTTYEMDGVNGTGIQFRDQRRSIVTDTNYIECSGNISKCYFNDLENSAISFQATGGGSISSCQIGNVAEAAIWVVDSQNLTITDTIVDGVVIGDIVAPCIEASRSYGLQVVGGSYANSETVAIDLQGCQNFSINTTVIDAVGADPRKSYAPLAEDWTGSTQGAGDDAGNLVSDATRSYIKLASLNGMHCKDGVIDVLCKSNQTDPNALEIYAFSSNNSEADSVYDIHIYGDACNPVPDAKFTNGRVYEIAGVTTWEKIHWHSVFGHASYRGVVTRDVIPSATSGSYSITFGFSSAEVEFKLGVTPSAAFAANSSYSLRDGEMYGTMWATNGTNVYSNHQYNNLTLRDQGGVPVFQATITDYTKDGITINITTCTEDVALVAATNVS